MKNVLIVFVLLVSMNLQAQMMKKSPPRVVPSQDPIQKYLNAAGLQSGDLWNAAFVYWCYNFYPGGNPLPKTGSGMEMWSSLSSRLKIPIDRALGDPGSIIPGNIFFISESGKEARVGIVVSVNNYELETVEADVALSPSRRIYSNEVIRKNRTISEINLGFSNFGSNDSPPKSAAK